MRRQGGKLEPSYLRQLVVILEEPIKKHQAGGNIVNRSDGNFTEVAKLRDVTKAAPTADVSIKDIFSGDSINLTSHDKAQLTSLVADLSSLGVSMAGAGTVPWTNIAAAVGGLTGTALQFYADQRDGFQLSDLGSAGLNLVFDVGTIIPFLGGPAKMAKASKTIKTLKPLLMTAFGVMGLSAARESLSKDVSK